MGLEQVVTIFPQDASHRLVGKDLATFLDRLTERMVALGHGARARVRAGRFDDEVRNLPDLLDTLEAARRQCRGREDLEVRLWGDASEEFARFLGTHTLEVKLCAFVEPHLLLDARLCNACGWPMDYDATRQMSTCATEGCGDDVAREGELHCFWWVRLFGQGSDGIGERFVEEGRRLRGTRFFDALEGAARAPLHEWHAWS